MHDTSTRLRVVIVGGGIAAAEAALALRASAADRVDIELIAADPLMPFRPASTVARFTSEQPQRFSLRALAEDVGATFLQDRLEAVAGDARRIRLASGAQRGYDALVLALGARARAALPGAVMFRDQRDAGPLQRVLEQLREGAWRGLAVAVPAGASWTLPAYELALLAAAEVQRLGLRTQISLVTPEPSALAAFGVEVGNAVATLLADRRVRLVCGALPETVDRRGLRVRDQERIHADRVIALPVLVGQAISGLPVTSDGFVRTQTRGCVVGMPDVHAAGDMTAFAIKQGGVAAQQADAIAARIATRAGATVPLPPSTLFLRAQLFGAPAPLFLESALDPRGRPLAGSTYATCPWWPHGTLFGRHVSPWMAQQALDAGAGAAAPAVALNA